MESCVRTSWLVTPVLRIQLRVPLFAMQARGAVAKDVRVTDLCLEAMHVGVQGRDLPVSPDTLLWCIPTGCTTGVHWYGTRLRRLTGGFVLYDQLITNNESRNQVRLLDNSRKGMLENGMIIQLNPLTRLLVHLVPSGPVIRRGPRPIMHLLNTLDGVKSLPFQ